MTIKKKFEDINNKFIKSSKTHSNIGLGMYRGWKKTELPKESLGEASPLCIYKIM
jgi:hypothetical protein